MKCVSRISSWGGGTSAICYLRCCSTAIAVSLNSRPDLTRLPHPSGRPPHPARVNATRGRHTSAHRHDRKLEVVRHAAESTHRGRCVHSLCWSTESALSLMHDLRV